MEGLLFKMFRCRWCKKLIMAGAFCACLGAATDDLHDHQEQSAPPETRRLAVAVSTATAKSNMPSSVWEALPTFIATATPLAWRITPPST